MRKILNHLVALMALLTITSSVAAQALVSFAVVEIDLWAEYDRPAMLVIYRMQLSEETVFPVDLSFQIPANAGNPTAVAMGNTSSTIADVNYTRKVAGETATIKFVATGAFIQFEYYDTNLNLDTDVRHYEYIWPGEYAVDVVWLGIKLPGDAQAVSLPAGFSAGELGDDGFLEYQSNGGQTKAGELLYIPISYSAGGDARQIYVWILGGIGALLIVVGVVRYYRSASGSRSSRKVNRKRSTSKPRTEKLAAYCHSCGQQSQKSDKYCRNCGVKLRSR